MIGWIVELSKTAQKEFRRLGSGPKRDASELMEDLAEDPTLVAATEMRGYQNTWKARFHGDQYRMVFEIAEARRRVRVIRIRPRPTAYEGMKR